jgi:DNA-binding NarL/FixJ family response regulator
MFEEYARAEDLLRQCLDIFRQLGDEDCVAGCMYVLAAVTAARGRSSLDQAPARGGRAEALTLRELQVANFVALGLSNREISGRLRIAEGTVRRHVSNILAKLEFHSRTQIARWVVEAAGPR